MSGISSRAGLLLGMAASLCASSVRADDLRTAQALVESGVFLSHAETDAAFARLDGEVASDKAKPDTAPAQPNAVFWDSAGSSFAQDERAGRLGYSGSETLMRLGFDRALSTTARVGVMASAGFGSIASGDLESQTVSRHANVYGVFTRGPLFAKLVVGGSLYDFLSLDRGPDNDQSRGSTRGTALQAASQLGTSFRFAGVKMTPTVALGAYASRVAGYDECGGAAPLSFNARDARAAIGSVRLAGSKSVRLDPNHTVEVQAFVSAEDVVAFRASTLVATAVDGLKTRLGGAAAPTGRGVVSGVGLGTDLAPGVNLTVNYDYGLRDGLATHASRARLGVSF
ncbi:MAG: autotransporter outer membrane beta-barrel domain-containing protein [Hansschlegelia sp.]